MAGPGNPRKFLCHFWGLDFWWQKDRSVTKLRNAATFRLEGPQIGLEKWHQALGFRSGDLAAFWCLFCVCFIGCWVVIIGCFVLLCYPFFCFVNAWFFFVDCLARFFPPNSRVIIMLPTQTSCTFFFRGNPSNLPYIRSVSFPPNSWNSRSPSASFSAEAHRENLKCWWGPWVHWVSSGADVWQVHAVYWEITLEHSQLVVSKHFFIRKFLKKRRKDSKKPMIFFQTTKLGFVWDDREVCT